MGESLEWNYCLYKKRLEFALPVSSNHVGYKVVICKPRREPFPDVGVGFLKTKSVISVTWSLVFCYAAKAN